MQAFLDQVVKGLVEHPDAVPIYSYLCGTDHIFSPVPKVNNILLANQTMVMYQQLVSNNSMFVAEVDDTGHLRVFNTVAATSSVVWSSESSITSNSTSFSLHLRDDGRLVVLDSTTNMSVWSSSNESKPTGSYFAKLQHQGTISIFSGTPFNQGELIWNSSLSNASSP